MKKNCIFWLLLMPIAWSIAACSDKGDNPADPVVPIPVTPTDETLSDTYQPGDNFYLYCNDKWMAQQTVDFDGKSASEQFYAHFPTEVNAVFMQQMETIVSPTLQKLKKDFVADENAYAQNKLLIEQASKRLSDCKTKEELWLTVGQMIKEGYPSPIEILPLNLKGRLTLVFYTLDKVPQTAEVRHAATRGSNTEAWPMLAKICEGLGIDAEYAYVVADNVTALQEFLKAEYDEYLLNLQNATLEQTAQFFINKLSELDNYCNPERTGSEDKRQQILDRLETKYLTYEKTKLYCDKYVTAAAKQKAADICETLRTAFAKRLENSPWMSDASKANALKKLNAMVFNIGSPDQWITEALPDISQKTTIVEDVLELRRATLAMRLVHAGKTSKELGFHSLILSMVPIPPLTMNDNYDSWFNCINIFPPFMQVLASESDQMTAEDFANYAVVGHEMTHGFDTEGALYNDLGDMESIWASDADAQEYNRRVEMLNDCYNHLEMIPGVMSDGTFCAPENIADLGGFMIAFDACKAYFTAQGYSGEKLNAELRKFYIAFARFFRAKYTSEYAMKYYNMDQHSMPQERINGVVSNTNVWYDLFDIRPGDKLYRSSEQRVYIW
jgi:predicted metalloendopeptidase